MSHTAKEENITFVQMRHTLKKVLQIEHTGSISPYNKHTSEKDIKVRKVFFSSIMPPGLISVLGLTQSIQTSYV